MTDYTLDEAKFILGLVAGRETGFTTPTQVRDAARVVLDHLAEEPEWDYGVKWPSGLLDTPYDDAEEAYEDARGVKGTVFRRRAPGQWVPVKQEGADQ